MIRVSGNATLRVNYSVELNMSEEEFDVLSDRKQNELLDAHIDWMDACRSGEVDEIEVDELEEFDDEESA